MSKPTIKIPINEVVYLRGIAVDQWMITPSDFKDERTSWNQMVTAYDAYLEGRELTPYQVQILDAEFAWHKDKMGM